MATVWSPTCIILHEAGAPNGMWVVDGSHRQFIGKSYASNPRPENGAGTETDGLKR